MEETPKICWEDVPCPLCSAKEEAAIHESVDADGSRYRLVRCQSCGLGYLNPRPNAESIGHYYPADYRPYQIHASPKSTWRERIERRLLTLFHGFPGKPGSRFERFAMRLLHPFFGPRRDSMTSLPYSGAGRLLDFGCGSGWFAHRMSRRGWNVVGMDFSEHSARRAREAYGLQVHVGTLPHPAIEPSSFDAITMGSVLEHVHEPHRVIEAAIHALKPGGFLAIAVPNLESWSMRRFLPNCFLLDLPRHLLHFSPGTLTKLLTSHGLEVRELRMLSRASWMKRTLDKTWQDRGASRSQRWLARLSGLWGVRSAVTRWTVQSRQADLLLALAYRPSRQAPHSPLAA